MVPENYKGAFLDLLIEYTKAQLKVLDDNPSMSEDLIHYKLQRTIDYMEKMKGERTGHVSI